MLYAAFRRHAGIYAWDIRGDTSTPVRVMHAGLGMRPTTNQRLRFDVDIAGRWLCSGDEVCAYSHVHVCVCCRSYLGCLWRL
jgi:hypothetical protein